MLPIPSAPGYWASSDGEIWRSGKRLRPSPNERHYLRVAVCIDGVPRTRYAHRLVAEAYHGPCPAGQECRHLNGVRSDNRPDNLAWSDKATNEADKIIHDTLPHGTRSVLSKLTDEIVTKARTRAADGENVSAIAQEFGVNARTLGSAVMGRKYKNLPGALEAYSTRRKFTPEQILLIRERAKAESPTQIAREFGVTLNAIKAIRDRKTYAHVEHTEVG